MDSLYIALCYLRFYKFRTIILLVCTSVILILPVALNLILTDSQRILMQRAETTPLIVGSKGSSLDLAMSALYFTEKSASDLEYLAVDELQATGLANAIPLYVKFNARGFPIVGTTEAYLDLRDHRVVAGERSLDLGQCLVGAEVAKSLGLKPGDSLVSSPEQIFDIAGVYPLKMEVAGILAPTFSADDEAIIVSLETSWIIAGLFHGHEDLEVADASVKVNHDKGALGSKLVLYSQVTGANRDSFHAHGDAAAMPVSAVVLVPDSDKSSAILQGRYLTQENPYLIIRPTEVVDRLMNSIFRFKVLLDTVVLSSALAAVLALILVFTLSIRLRQRELATNFKIGCSRMATVRMLAGEILLVLIGATLIAALVWAVIRANVGNLLGFFIQL